MIAAGGRCLRDSIQALLTICWSRVTAEEEALSRRILRVLQGEILETVSHSDVH